MTTGGQVRAVSIARLAAVPSFMLTWIAGTDGSNRTVAVPRIQKPGLALTGWPEQLHQGRVLILGGTELEYLAQLDASACARGIATILASAPACVMVARGLAPPNALVEACGRERIPLFRSDLVTSELITKVTAWLIDELAERTERHGVLLDILGIGVLLLGKSGIGKSETALDLVVRGHRLVADDVVELWPQQRALMGAGIASIRHHMEVRGLGIINIKDLFGIAAVRNTKRVELVVELVEWSDHAEYDRLGLDDHAVEILGIAVPHIVLPVRPGRNLSTLVEVAARNQLLKAEGHHSAQRFATAMRERMVGHISPRHEVEVDDALE